MQILADNKAWYDTRRSMLDFLQHVSTGMRSFVFRFDDCKMCDLLILTKLVI